AAAPGCRHGLPPRRLDGDQTQASRVAADIDAFGSDVRDEARVDVFTPRLRLPYFHRQAVELRERARYGIERAHDAVEVACASLPVEARLRSVDLGRVGD